MVNRKFPAEPGARSGGLAAGSQVAGYKLERQIGAGGMAVVFLARDERLQRQVALKILDPALAADEEFRNRFIRESRAAAAVDDPNIVPIFEAGEADGVLCCGYGGRRRRRRPSHRALTLERTTAYPTTADRLVYVSCAAI
jgi:serine/threonine protein kinase